MFKFILKRVTYGIITLFFIVSATFFLIAGAPGDPIVAKCKQMPEKTQKIIRAKYGLDKPVYVRYIMYMKNLITKGDLGDSIIYTGRSVNEVIKKNAPISARIGGIALVLQLIIGVLLGLISALNREKVPDHIIRVLVVLAICIPSFVFAAVLQYFVAFKWKFVPVFGWGKPIHYILPVIAMTLGGIASYCKYMRNSTISVLNEDYIITAKSKGVKTKGLIKKHILRNAMIPIVTMIGPAIAGIFGGAFVLEKMFGIPGLGSYYVKAVADNDYTMILGQTVFFAALYIASLIIVDILYSLVDPRIRVAKGAK